MTHSVLILSQFEIGALVRLRDGLSTQEQPNEATAPPSEAKHAAGTHPCSTSGITRIAADEKEVKADSFAATGEPGSTSQLPKRVTQAVALLPSALAVANRRLIRELSGKHSLRRVEKRCHLSGENSVDILLPKLRTYRFYLFSDVLVLCSDKSFKSACDLASHAHFAHCRYWQP